jgi:hypothetical protein
VSNQEDPMRTTVKPVHPWTTLDEQKPTKFCSRRSTCWVIVATWAVAHVLLYWSLDLGVTVTTADAASHIPMGLPFPFLYQDQSRGFALEVDRVHWENSFPTRTIFWSPLENPTHVIWPNYFLDLALVWWSLLLITWLLLWVIWKIRRAERARSGSEGEGK